MFKKNIHLYLVILILILFTFFYFNFANKISYAFDYDTAEVLYENKMNLINIASQNYYKINPELFAEKNVIYITVKDLINAKLIEADDEHGNLKDPRSDVKNLNNLKIRLSIIDDKLQVKLLDNELDK